MEVNNLLTHEPAQASTAPLPNGMAQLQQQQQQQQQQRYHQYPTRHSTTSTYPQDVGDDLSTPPPNSASNHVATPNSYSASPQNSANPKNVAFELLFPESPNYRARLPMRVQIFPHDTTDSIVTTVKNFYGLYEGPGGAKGISFEDERGHTLIASHENFLNNMVIYVRVLVEPPPRLTQGYPDPPAHTPGSPMHDVRQAGCYPGESRQMLPPQPAQALTYGQPPSRPHSRMARDRSASPQPGRGRRSISANTNHDPSKPNRLRPGLKSRGSSAHGSGADPTGDAMNGFSDSDGGHGSSVTSSKKAKSEQLASAEISLDNIVEGGRRKRAKFESSELPLFVPPQVPMAASSSSVSPARRTVNQLGPTPFAQSGQRTFAYPYPVPSPQTAGQSATGYAFGPPSGSSLSTPSGPPHGHHLRNRVSGAYPTPRGSSGATPTGHLGGILPTPDPTIASCISDEDVALQLMRLGDTSNISHGRHSASTLDDGLSGVADAASSTGATSDGEGESDGTEQPGLPPAGPARAPLESSPIPLPGSIKRRHKHLDEILPSFDSTEPSGDESGRATDRRDHADDRRDGTYAIKGETRRSDAFMDELELAIRPEFSAPRPGPLVTPRPRSHHAKAKSAKATPSRIGVPHKGKAKGPALPSGAIPISPASLPSQSRKTSGASVTNFQHALGADEEDLSSKPRCQRCRKSKKGCDRQRPCQRCRDAGIGIEGCVSEDEGNGRKGRFGRHMGVIVKKGAHEGDLAGGPSVSGSPSGSVIAGGGGMQEKSKKRKR